MQIYKLNLLNVEKTHCLYIIAHFLTYFVLVKLVYYGLDFLNKKQRAMKITKFILTSARNYLLLI